MQSFCFFASQITHSRSDSIRVSIISSSSSEWFFHTGLDWCNVHSPGANAYTVSHRCGRRCTLNGDQQPDQKEKKILCNLTLMCSIRMPFIYGAYCMLETKSNNICCAHLPSSSVFFRINYFSINLLLLLGLRTMRINHIEAAIRLFDSFVYTSLVARGILMLRELMLQQMRTNSTQKQKNVNCWQINIEYYIQLIVSIHAHRKKSHRMQIREEKRVVNSHTTDTGPFCTFAIWFSAQFTATIGVTLPQHMPSINQNHIERRLG